MARRSVLITGCSQGGAGEALARTFFQNGFRVFATARTLSKIQHLEAEGIDIVELNVLETQSIERAAEKVSSLTGGTLDILINSAGAGYMSPILDIEYDKASKIFDLNVFAPMCVVRAFISQLIVSKGSIVNIGSYADVLPIPWQAVYNASKAALRSFTDILRLELLPFNVKVVYIAAGGIQSNFLNNLETLHLSKTSLYYPAREILEPIINYESLKKNHPGAQPMEFAQEVYNAVAAGVPGYRVYAGQQSSLCDLAPPERDELLAAGAGIKEYAEQVETGRECSPCSKSRDQAREWYYR